MKVWEKINQLKDTDVTRDFLRGWCMSNRITPDIMEDGLALEPEEYPEELRHIAQSTDNDNAYKWLDDFLDSECN